MQNNRIAIVGAGVAGIALAIVATKLGYQVTLYERDTEVSSIGAGVTLWPNAMFVLQQMGLDKEIIAMGGVPSYMRQFDQYGVQQGELNIAAVNDLSGYPSVTILRRDLMRILARALADLGVNIQFNCLITTADINGLKQKFDLVVGADGRMNSIVRHALYPEQVQPRYQGFINIIGISQLEGSVLNNAIHDYRGMGERFGIVPIKTGECYWAAGWSANMDKERPVSAWYQELQQRFLHWPNPVQQVLKSSETNSLKLIFVHDLDPLPYWHRDNVLIIGDAAHAPLPTSGQGACQALEDAWHLAQGLVKNDQLDNTLSDFYQQRIPKATATQSVGRQLAQQLFSDSFASQAPIASISPKRLSEFWMQGLTLQ